MAAVPDHVFRAVGSPPLRRLSRAGKDGPLDVVRLPGVAARGARLATRVGISPFSFVDSPLVDQWMESHAASYDVVLVHLARAVFPMRIAKKALAMRLPLYVQSHGMLARRSPLHYLTDAVTTRHILAGARSVLSLQDHEDGELRGIHPDCRLHRLPNGISQVGLPSWSPQSTNVVLFVGRIHKRKRLPALIQAIGLMTIGGFPARLRVAGPDEGDLLNAQTQVARLGLQDQVEFLGPLSQESVFEEMQKATCLALPSADEPFPRSVLEGLAIAIPALVTETCHIAPLLAKHRAALVTGESPESLKDGLSRLLLDDRLREDLATHGRELITKHLNEAAVAHRLESLFLKRHANSTRTVR